MKKNFFWFKKNSKIILYGAASIGHLMFNKLLSLDYHIVGFIDKRAEELEEYLGVPVWTISTVPGELKADQDTVVFLAVKNVFEHHTIVEQLLRSGFTKIIYKPYSILINEASENDKDMDAVYEQIFNGIPDKELQVLCTTELYSIYDKDYAIQKRDEEYTVALIPVDFIFTNAYQDTEMKKWGNINILAFFTHLNFFDFLQGDLYANYMDYLNEYCVFTAKLGGKIKITDEWKKNVLHNRAQVYEEMCRALLLDNEFFIRVPPQAVWNEKGYFNLTSGKHRATFLASKQHYLIPLKITNKDYLSYLNKIHFELLKPLLMKGLTWDAFIPHPYCYRMPGISYTYYGVISAIVRKLAQKMYQKYRIIQFDKLSVLDDTADNGVLGAYFARMGAEVIRYGISENEDLAEAVWELGHVNGKIKTIDENFRVEQVDVFITDLTRRKIKTAFHKKLNFDEGFVICREEIQSVEFAKKYNKKNVLRIFNTFREDGEILVYWLY